MDSDAIEILDCHVHFFDARRFRYPVFEAAGGGLEALPRVYLPEDYARDTAGLRVTGTVWAEFMSGDPVEEVRWADELADASGSPNGLIASVDFLDPALNQILDRYTSLKHIRCVRQHLGWHPTNTDLRFAARPDFLSDDAWRGRIGALRGRDVCCELEVFSTQLRDLTPVVAAHPDIQFVLPLIGWPIDLTDDGFKDWKRDLTALGKCPNVAVKILGMESIFGVRWTASQVRPWILEAIEIFGPTRCMFASLTPLCTLACSIQQVYAAYFEIIAAFSVSEKRQLLHDTAARVYGIR